MNRAEVAAVLDTHGIAIREIKTITGSFDKEIFLINDEYVLRPSLQDMSKEQENFARIGNLDRVPRLRWRGDFQSGEKLYHYTMVTMLQGIDFIDAVSEMPEARQEALGVSVSVFLDSLHSISGNAYDIGHYIPLIPNHAGSWENGHEKYWEYLRERIAEIGIGARSKNILDAAFRYLHSRSGVLEFQAGPVLLHNDFHPKNIIVNGGAFSGVIDWECSQFGEADFDLCHLIHWCLFPPKPGADFRPFLRSLVHASPKCASAPNLAERLTIYQIEHELIQLIWSGGTAETERSRRLACWLDGSVDDLLRY